MKRHYLFLFIFTLFTVGLNAQQVLQRSATKYIDVAKQKFKSTRFEVHDVFEYDSKFYVLASGIKVDLKLSTGVFGAMAKGAAGRSVDIPGAAIGKGGYYNLNTFLIVGDPTVPGIKGIKVQKLDFPAALKKAKYEYLGFMQKDALLNIYIGSKNNKLKKSFVFNLAHNLKSNETKFDKVFETAKRNDPIAFFKSEKMGYAGFASAYGVKGNPKLSYLITDINGQVKNKGNEIDVPGVKKTSITNFKIGKNGELVMAITFKEKRSNYNEIYIVKRGEQFRKVAIPSKAYTSNKLLFLGNDDVIKAAFLSGDNDSYFSELIITDIDVNSARAANEVVKTFESLKLNDSKKEYKSDKKKQKKAQGGYSLTDVEVAGDGTTMLLMEKIEVVTRSRTSSNGAVSSTTTYYYGPGKMVLLNDKNELLKMSKMTYRMPGGGLEFLPLNEQNILVHTSSNFKRYDLKKDLVSVSRKGDGNRGYRDLVKGIKGDFETFRKFGDKIYIVKIASKSKFRINTFKID